MHRRQPNAQKMCKYNIIMRKNRKKSYSLHTGDSVHKGSFRVLECKLLILLLLPKELQLFMPPPKILQVRSLLHLLDWTHCVSHHCMIVPLQTQTSNPTLSLLLWPNCKSHKFHIKIFNHASYRQCHSKPELIPASS